MTQIAAQASPHYSVMLDEVLDALAPKDGGVYVDGTFGAGGYSKALLDAADCRVIGIDRDPTALASGQALVEAYAGRLTLLDGCFGNMESLVRETGVDGVDGIALDVGVSSMQLDQGMRGFSFQSEGPLDMRMSREGVSAADVVNHMEEADIARILFLYGEEKRSRAVAREIVRVRAEKPIKTTLELARLVATVIKPRATQRINPATRTFQALRIYVNQELHELGHGLAGAEALLVPGGRLAVVSFHSLEDRIVKRFFAERTGRAGRGSRHMPEMPDQAKPSFAEVTRRAATAGEAELVENARSRSAKLRAGERTQEAVMPIDFGVLGLKKFPVLEEVI
ncbi:MAG: 16S rRNA (cytosine(1402)-N(4))-methyltransferase RsmH [Parvibaculaceae bacterium]|nr:16S rRNA (cytosine(1402)-N(4))-methyltransferase RsmH [Parvibaculaceae bacterium]